MDDLTLFNLVSSESFFSRYSYHNLIITALGRLGPNSAAMDGFFFF